MGSSTLTVDVYNGVGIALDQSGCAKLTAAVNANERLMLPVIGPGDCKSWFTPAGDRIDVSTMRSAAGHIDLQVFARRVDGTEIQVICQNYTYKDAQGAKDPTTYPVQRTVPALTEAQLVKIALDPQLSYFP